MLAHRILHHGAVRGVTGSCHELALADGASLLVDCGLFQGAETSGSGAGPGSPQIDFPIAQVRALVLTHVHIDHCGRLPYLLEAGFAGPIYCSMPSAMLLPLVIEDALAIGATRNRELIERRLAQLEQQLRPLAYGKWQRIDTGTQTGLEIRLQRAGHILGSAYVECRITTLAGRPSGRPGADPVGRPSGRQGTDPVGRPSGRLGADVGLKPDLQPVEPPGQTRHRVIFSGDLGASHTPLLPEPTPPLGCDTLVIESTYGDSLHEGRTDRVRRLQQVIERALSDRGAVLIPAFSIGRTQELLYEIEDIIHANRNREATRGLPWGELEIVVDSPLAARFTRVYDRLRPFWDAEALGRVREGRHPLSFEQLRTVDSHADHLRIVEHIRKTRYPAIVLAASGMCAGGRIVNYLKALVGDERTDILFVGYQAAGTPGRAIQQYGPAGGWVELDGERHAIKARVHTLSGYSAHADQSDLLRFVTGMRRVPLEVRVVHGDPQAKQAFCRVLRRTLAETVVRAGEEGSHH